MAWLGWNSLEAVTRLHDAIVVGGMVFSALVIVAGFAADRFEGKRNASRARRLVRAGLVLSAVVLASQWAADRFDTRRQALAEQRRTDERATSQRQIEAAQKHASRAEERAAQAEAKTGRELTPDQQQKLTGALAKSRPSRLTIYWADGESAHYAEQLASAIRAARWTVNIFSEVGMLGGGPERYVVLQFRGAPSDAEQTLADDIARLRPRALVPDAGRVLAQALDSVGIKMKFATIVGGERGAVELFVGVKP